MQPLIEIIEYGTRSYLDAVALREAVRSALLLGFRRQSDPEESNWRCGYRILHGKDFGTYA